MYMVTGGAGFIIPGAFCKRGHRRGDDLQRYGTWGPDPAPPARCRSGDPVYSLPR